MSSSSTTTTTTTPVPFVPRQVIVHKFHVSGGLGNRLSRLYRSLEAAVLLERQLWVYTQVADIDQFLGPRSDLGTLPSLPMPRPAVAPPLLPRMPRSCPPLLLSRRRSPCTRAAAPSRSCRRAGHVDHRAARRQLADGARRYTSRYATPPAQMSLRDVTACVASAVHRRV